MKALILVCAMAISSATYSPALLASSAAFQVCPTDFHTVSMPSNATLCQRFDSGYPATMVFYSQDSQQVLVDHYRDAYPGLEVRSTVQGRTLLTADNNSVRVIISPDNDGSQVDMMITTAR
ncbi:hypothetical protein [Aestuariibacter sp. A3R04]|uniref:hypothetical protein n=1 Tax=Aestuariibacter sp. A3R04 TaxID=2841571 RepID=UPI001C080E16|nr:hypothetical protein [Aestuariibacter sp. A3R04]MBU3021442.1 hypothetical protein [Aestuariibacter sp. A3R04]